VTPRYSIVTPCPKLQIVEKRWLWRTIRLRRQQCWPSGGWLRLKGSSERWLAGVGEGGGARIAWWVVPICCIDCVRRGDSQVTRRCQIGRHIASSATFWSCRRSTSRTSWLVRNSTLHKISKPCVYISILYWAVSLTNLSCWCSLHRMPSCVIPRCSAIRGLRRRPRRQSSATFAPIIIIIIIIITTTMCYHLWRQPYARVHCGSSGPKSVSARWPPTRRPCCKSDLWVRL